MIDERTNIFTLGALLFEFFGSFTGEEIGQRYALNRFLPCAISCWQLNEEIYHIVCKAVALNRHQRYTTVKEFWMAWREAVEKLPGKE